MLTAVSGNRRPPAEIGLPDPSDYLYPGRRQPVETAFHEAGHAVATVALGRRFRYITLRPRDSRHTGNVALARPRPIHPLDLALKTLAGPAAEAGVMMLREGDWGLDEFTAEDDALSIRNALRHALEAGGHGELEEAFEDAIRWGGSAWENTLWATSQIVVENWAGIDRLARALLASSRALNYAEARRALDTVWSPFVVTDELVASAN